MLCTNSIHKDAYYYERIGFRAAWISIMQVPFVIILAGKVNLIGMLIGSSYERLNWLHRWAARMLFICVTIHGAFFLSEWVKADFVSYELQMMAVVKYGMGAWFVLLWMNLTGLAPIRHVAYEIFVLQHIAAGVIFLWLIYMHAPQYARFYLWISVGFMAFDRAARWAWWLYRNCNVFGTRGVISRLADRIGYRAELQVVPGDTTRITIKNVPWKWKPGQHIYLTIPRIGFIEAHPFTISNTCSQHSSKTSSATIAVRTHNGFTKRLYKYASRRSQPGKPVEVRAFIQGPFGAHPDWNTFETVVLVSASTGCSFTLPILEGILDDPCCVRHVTFMLLVRHRPQCTCYLGRLREAAVQAAELNIIARIQVVVTGKAMDSDSWEGDVGSRCICGPDTPAEACCCGSHVESSSEKREDITEHQDEEEAIGSCCASNKNDGAVQQDLTITKAKHGVLKELIATSTSSKLSSKLSVGSTNKGVVEFSSERPDLSEYVRYPVEAARGETCIAVCGGKSLTGYVRNTVAKLSDERAVHKGTGAQGICLHVEEFGL
jgi:NAD(P)H-flavin reductase